MKRLILASALLSAIGAAAPAARAQALPAQVQALYPAQAGEIVFVDVRALRGTRHYPELKSQVLPEKFRQLEQWVKVLGADLDRDVNQLSWAFLSADESASSGFMGVAEGAFDPTAALDQARLQKLGVARHNGQALISLGSNSGGKEFVFAFLDQTVALFGFRDQVVEMLDRRSSGGQGFGGNPDLRDVIGRVNGKSPVWLALDSRFASLAVRQFLPEATRVPGFENLAGRVRTASLRFDLSSGLKSDIAVRCQDSADSAWLATLMQLALSYQAVQLGPSQPELARALGDVKMDRSDDRVTAALAIADSDLATMLRKNTFALKF